MNKPLLSKRLVLHRAILRKRTLGRHLDLCLIYGSMTGATRSADPRSWRGELARSRPRALRQGGPDRRRAPRAHSMRPCRRAWLCMARPRHTLPRGRRPGRLSRASRLLAGSEVAPGVSSTERHAEPDLRGPLHDREGHHRINAKGGQDQGECREPTIQHDVEAVGRQALSHDLLHRADAHERQRRRRRRSRPPQGSIAGARGGSSSVRPPSPVTTGSVRRGRISVGPWARRTARHC